MQFLPNPYRTPAIEYELNPQRGFFSIIVPEESTNLVLNPSIELDTDGYFDLATGTLERSDEKQLFGGYSLKYTPDTNVQGGIRYELTVTPDLIYTASAYVWGVNSQPYRFYLYDNDLSTVLSEVQFTGRGDWVRYTVTGTAGPGDGTVTELWIVVRKNNNASVTPFYVDGVQLEQKGYSTTYLDGDMPSLIPGQRSFFWVGTRHASRSVRMRQTNAGGRIKRLDDFGFHVISMLGLGMPPVTNVAQNLALTGGASYQRTIAQTRPFTLIGDVTGYTLSEVQRQRKQLMALMQAQKIVQQPMILRYQLYECRNIKGEEIEIPCVYSGGFEGLTDNLNHERIGLQFQAYSPFPQRVFESASVTSDLIVENPGNDFITQRKFDLEGITSAWQRVVQGTDGLVLAMAWGPDGKLYVGGTFVNAINNPPTGPTVVNYITVYDPLLDQWFDLNQGVDNYVRSLAFDSEGNLYVGGDFTQGGAPAVNLNGVGVWNIYTETWSGLGGTPGVAGGIVNAVALDSLNQLFVGGTFTSAGGAAADRMAYWDGSAWFPLVAPGSGPNAAVEAIEVDLTNDTVYFGGAFTTVAGSSVGYIASYTQPDGIVHSLGAGLGGTVYTIQLLGGILYVGGAFVEAGGNDLCPDPLGGKIATWNGNVWGGLGGGLVGGDVGAIAYDYVTGTIFVGGSFTHFYQSMAASPIELGDGFVGWNGVAWFHPDVKLPDNPTEVRSLLGRENGDFMIGHSGQGNATTTQLFLIDNQGDADAYPRIFMFGEGYVRQIINYTTSEEIYFDNLQVLPGEVIILDLSLKTIVSNVRGNLLGRVTAGSDLATLRLIPGQNIISIYLPNALAEVNILWHDTYLSFDSAVT